MLAVLAEPVRRYLTHALADGAGLPTAARLRMSGRINVGRWLAFAAEQDFVDHSFQWRARAGWGRLKPLHVVDAYRDGRASTEGRLLGRLRFMHADDENTIRAAAARAAVESIWVPGTLLPDRGVAWRAESDHRIVASFAVPPEHPEVVLDIDAAGAVRSVCVMRWGNVGRRDFGYIPFGGHIRGERRFGDVVLPSDVSVGWWFGTPQFEPFFEATIDEVAVTAASELR
jgi:uncharacterized protein DUF6544